MMAGFHQSANSQGFLSFLLASVFLFALVLSASSLNSQKPDLHYEQPQAMHIEGLAMKKAFYSSISNAAAAAFAASQASGAEPRNAMKFAIWHEAEAMQGKLAEAGYGTVFFCGQPSESAMQEASARMQESQKAGLPAGATSISSISCVHSFDVDLLERKIHVFGDGFCTYSKQLGMGYCGTFPVSYEVDF